MADLFNWNISLLLFVLVGISCLLPAEFRDIDSRAVVNVPDFSREKANELPKFPAIAPSLSGKNQNPLSYKSADDQRLSFSAEKQQLKQARSGDNLNPKPKKEHMKIAESNECMDDVKMLCPEKANSNNFVILECLQDDEKVHILLGA